MFLLNKTKKLCVNLTQLTHQYKNEAKPYIISSWKNDVVIICDNQENNKDITNEYNNKANFEISNSLDNIFIFQDWDRIKR